MSNVEKVAPQVEIELGGKVRRLVCDMWALAMMETASGESAMYGKLFNDMTMNKLITVMWACLLEDPEVAEATEKRGIVAARKLVAKWMEFKRYEEMLNKCLAAFKASADSGEDEGEQAEGKEAAQKENSTG